MGTGREGVRVADPAAGRSELDPEQHQLIYGRWAGWLPAQVNDLLADSGVRWWIGGGRAARVGATPREHEDTDVVVRLADLPKLREHLSDWHLWEVDSGWLRLLSPTGQVHEGSEQLWVRRDAEHPWVADLLLDRSTDDVWVFKKDRSLRLPWDRALHLVDGILYLRPELALLHKAHLDRVKDRADLEAAALNPEARDWLAATLEQRGYTEWAGRLRRRCP